MTKSQIMLLSNLLYPFQQINGLVGSKLDVADEFMNDPTEASDEVESRGKEDADENSDGAAAAPNAKKVRVGKRELIMLLVMK